MPGNYVAIELTHEFAGEIRRFEVHLKERIIGSYPQRRGSSDTNTRKAIDSVINLCETGDNVTVLGVLSYIATWTRRAENVFTPQNGLHRLPRQPGEGEARCPYCSFQSMRWHPASGVAVCIRPACRDTDGQRPRWTAEYTPIGDQLVFHWREQQEAA